MHTRIKLNKGEQCPQISYSFRENGEVSFSLPFFKGEGAFLPLFGSVDNFCEALQRVGDMLQRLVDKSNRFGTQNFLITKRIDADKELFFINVNDYTSACIAIELQPLMCELQSNTMTIEDLWIVSSPDFIKDFEEDAFENRKIEVNKFSARADADMITSHYIDFKDVVVDGILFCRIENSVYKKFCDIRKETPEEAIRRFIWGKNLKDLGQDIYNSCGITINAYVAAQIYTLSGSLKFY